MSILSIQQYEEKKRKKESLTIRFVPFCLSGDVYYGSSMLNIANKSEPLNQIVKKIK